MSWTAPATVAVGQVATAAMWNQQVRDNMIDLDRRTTITPATVATSQTSTSTTYTDLATAGPAVTVTIGSTGRAQVTLYCSQTNNTANVSVFMGFAESGATVVAASDDRAIAFTPASAGVGARYSGIFVETGLTPGSTTFTAKYRVPANTGTWLDRKISVTPLGS